MLKRRNRNKMGSKWMGAVKDLSEITFTRLLAYPASETIFLVHGVYHDSLCQGMCAGEIIQSCMK